MHPILLEVNSPPLRWPKHKVLGWVQQISTVLHHHKITGISLPEIIDEERSGCRKILYSPKVSNLEFSATLAEANPNITPYLYKVVYSTSKTDFHQWLSKLKSTSIRNIVLVGRSHHQNFAGYTLLQAAELLQKEVSGVNVGAVTIFNREGEAKRLLEKVRNGTRFFISQIVYETKTMIETLEAFSILCKSEQLEMPTFYISLATISAIKDLHFLQWLGVEIAPPLLKTLVVEKTLKQNNEALLLSLIDEIILYKERTGLKIGFNLAPIMYPNLPLAEKIIHHIKNRIISPTN